MNKDIQAHYLGIEWESYGVARHVDVSTDPVRIERIQDDALYAEVSIFHNPAPWFGLQLSGALADVHPCTIAAQDERIEWLRIYDEHGGRWWVPATGWSDASNRHLSEMHRSFGLFQVELGAYVTLTLEAVSLELDHAQIQDYLDDFRDELVWLAIGQPTGAMGEVTSGYSLALIAALKEVITAVRRVLERPAVEIREVTAPVATYKLRPNSETFRAVMRRPAARSYPGRVAQESADIADNRYIYSMVAYCLRLAQTVARPSARYKSFLAARAEKEERRAHDLRNIEKTPVDEDVFNNQFSNKLKTFENVSKWSEGNFSDGMEEKKYEFSVTGIYNEGRGDSEAFFYKTANRRGSYDAQHDIKFSIARLPRGLHDLVKAAQALCKPLPLIIYGTAKVGTDITGKQKKFRLAKFVHVVSAHVNPFFLQTFLQQHEAKKNRYEQNDWWRPITSQERDEYNREAAMAQKKADWFHKSTLASAELARELDGITVTLRQYCNRWKRLGVTPNAAFPMGMRFTHNPVYAAVLVAFQKVKEVKQHTGLGEETLDMLGRINVLHASALYERWCLIKIIAVLLQEFDFTAQDGWVRELVMLVAKGRRQGDTHLKLNFQRNRPDIKAFFEVEPVLKNGRRPDFRLRFVLEPSDFQVLENDYSLTHSTFPYEKEKTGLVMDAKFRTKWKKNGLDEMVNNLVDVKDYGQDGESVFVIHPVKNALSSVNSPLIWGKDCDYGQLTPVNHMYGSIQLAAGAHTVAINLRRLVGLHLQKIFPGPVFSLEDGICRANDSFCVNCGRTHELSDVQRRWTKSGNEKWFFTCSHCHTKTLRTHCYNCRTTLYKSGLQMTYHMTVADQIAHVICPKCGSGF